MPVFASIFTILSIVVLNLMLAWNGGFFSKLKVIDLCNREYWIAVIKEPLGKIGNGWKRSILFRIILALYVLCFVPLLQYVLFPVIFILWRFFIAPWWEDQIEDEFEIFEPKVQQEIDNQNDKYYKFEK